MRAAVSVVCALLASALLLMIVADAQAMAGSHHDEEQRDRAREELRHARENLAKAERALNDEEPGLVDRFKTMTKDFFGRGESSGTEESSHTTIPAGDLFHRIKRSVGVEDESLWDKVKDAFQADEPSIFDKFKYAFGAKPPSWSDKVLNRVKHALSAEPASSKTDAFFHKIKMALGAENPTVGERVSEAWHGVTEKASEATGLTEDTWNSLVHRLKVTLGTESPTAWEKIQSAFGIQGQGVTDQIRSKFTTPDSIWEKIKHTLSGESNSEYLLRKAKEALVPVMQTVLPAAAHGVDIATDKTKDLLKGSSESYDELMHKLKVAVGAEDETLWEKVKNAVHPREGLFDKLKHTVTGQEPSTAQVIYDRIKNALPSGESRTDKILHKVKTALGLEEPTVMEKFKDVFSSHPVRDTAEELAQKGKEATEQLTGQSYEDVLHQIKKQIGVESPSIYEKLQTLWEPRRSIVDKIRHALGRDKPITRETLYDQITTLLGDDESGSFEPFLKRIRGVLGLETPSFLERAKERVAGLFRRKEKSMLEKAMDALRDSTESTRGGAMTSLQMALGETKRDLEEKARKLMEDVSRSPDKASKGYDEFKSLLGGFYSSIQRLTEQFDRNRAADMEHKDTFMQASKYDNKVAYHYINENGREFVDITGPFPDRYADKLRVINEFRKDFDLPEHNNIPDTASVQLHDIKQKHVICKAKRIIDGNVVEYSYDDGQETIEIDWKDAAHAATISPELSMQMASWFREDLGLPTTEAAKKSKETGILPKIRTTVQQLKSEL